jgi:hypothetical protein
MANHPEDWEEPMFVCFRELGFPPLDTLLADHVDLTVQLMLYLHLDLLNWLDVKIADGVKVYYSVNSLDTFIVSEGTVEMRGLAYENVLKSR